MSNRLRTYLILLGVGVAIAFASAALMGVFTAENAAEVFRRIADGSFISAVLIGGFGLLRWCGGQGAFDGLTFTFRTLWDVTTGSRYYKQRETYADYKERKAESRKGKGGTAPYLFVGLGFLLLTIVMTGMYHVFYVEEEALLIMAHL
ncbi:MAG: DUF3899 domain-containing protein [Christensenellaceae bacterium]